MPIKWSAVEVKEAMDKIEVEVLKAVPYLEMARTIVQEARRISNLPQYINQRLLRLDYLIAGTKSELKNCIDSVRASIPDGAIEAEREATKNGKTEKLM
jgi:hypothetical protein